MPSLSFLTTILLPLLLTPSLTHASSTGHAVVKNHCTDHVLLKYDAGQPTITPVSIAPKGTWKRKFENKATGGGPSIKLWRQSKSTGCVAGNLASTCAPNNGDITQFEYENGANPAFPYLSYDISNVDCHNHANTTGSSCPFAASGLLLETPFSAPSSLDCRNVACLPGATACPNVYAFPNDNQNANQTVQYSCSRTGNYDITLHLCPCEGGSNGGVCAAAREGGVGWRKGGSKRGGGRVFVG